MQKLPESTGSPGDRRTEADSPVSKDSSISAASTTTRPSATTWSPGPISRRSPSTTSLARICDSAPSRTTVARGAASACRARSVRVARSSCQVPMVMFAATTMPTKKASCAWPVS